MRRAIAVLLCGVVVLWAGGARAGEGEPVGEQPPPPPLPLHSIEGFSGVFLTETAYFANAPLGESFFGMPSFALSGTKIGEKELGGLTAAMNVRAPGIERLIEFGYSYQYLSLGDWDNEVERATGLRIGDDNVQLHTVGARLQVLREGEWDTTFVPAVSIGVRYKKNTEIDDIGDDLPGVPDLVGIDDDDGVDFTLKATKAFADVLPKPFILTAGLRATEAIHAGFVGFGDDYHVVFEGNGIFFITDQLVAAAEYRQMPHELKRLGELVRREDDWWSLALGYVVTSNLTVTAGYANLGRVLNHDEDACWLAQLKWEF